MGYSACKAAGKASGEAAASVRLAGCNREAQLQRAELQIEMKCESDVAAIEVYLDGQLVQDGVLKELKPGKQYHVRVKIPAEAAGGVE